MRRFALIAASVLLVGLASPVQSASTNKEFAEAWQAREARYTVQEAELDVAVKAASLNFSQRAGDPKERVDKLFAALDALAYAHGRSQLLRELRSHMARKPSAARTELWVQERVDDLKARAKAADDKGDAVVTFSRSTSFNPSEHMRLALQAVMASGEFRGTLDELILIDQNLASYYTAKSAEDVARREARSRFFAALGAAVAQTGRDRGWSATCTTSPLGTMTTCTGD